MKKSLFNALAFSFLLFSSGAAHAGIVFSFGTNVTPERQLALQAAAAEIEQILDLRQNVKISLSFKDTLQCGVSSAVLGFAGPQNAFGGFPGAPQADVWYVSAQAADMGYTTAMAETVHIAAQFNNKLGSAGCLPGVSWYFGTDHNPGPGQIDFLSTAVHEFMHGLGFLSFTGSDGKLLDNDGSANSGHLDNYSTFLFDAAAGKSWKNMTDSERAASILNDNDLVWEGTKTSAMVSLLQDGTTGGKPRLYAPATYENGSSTSHFDTSLYYNANADEVMEPYDSFPQQSIMASAAFCDMGWHLLRDTDGDSINDCDDADPLVFTDTDGDGVTDALDAFPSNAAASVDTDQDGKPDAWNQPNPYSCTANAPTCNGLTLDSDSDNDGVADAVDNCPLVANANQLDWDNDGIGNVCGDDVPMPDLVGAISKDKQGTAVAFAGDINNDSYGDYVIGIPGYDIPATPTAKAIKDVGRAVVISGKDGVELMSVTGQSAGDTMGSAVAGNADIDNDGFDDVIVGTPKADELANGLVDAGSATVLYGPDGVRTKTFYGAKVKALAGTSVALGDVNNDNYADIILGAPKDDDTSKAFSNIVDAGSVTMYSGNPATGNVLLKTYYGAMKGAYAGTSIAVGNIDAVSGMDIVIGASGDDLVQLKQIDNGSVTAYKYYSDTPILPKKYGRVSKAYFGKAVATGDVDKNGFDDVIIGAMGDDDSTRKLLDTGSVTVLFSASAIQPVTRYGDSAKAGLGKSVTAADLNGDGYAEVIAGAWKEDPFSAITGKKLLDAGMVSLWSGVSSTPFATLGGDVSKDYFGSSLAAGDINGDGKDDLTIGVPGKDVLAPSIRKDVGMVRLVSGVTIQ